MIKLIEDVYNESYRYYIADEFFEPYPDQPEEGYTEADVLKRAYTSILDDIVNWGAPQDEALEYMHIVDDKSNPCLELDNKVRLMIVNRDNTTEADAYDLALKYFDNAYSDEEILNDLESQGYSREFIAQVFDCLDDIYQK